MLVIKRQTYTNITEQNHSLACVRCFCIPFLNLIFMTNGEELEQRSLSLFSLFDNRLMGSLKAHTALCDGAGLRLGSLLLEGNQLAEEEEGIGGHQALWLSRTKRRDI